MNTKFDRYHQFSLSMNEEDQNQESQKVLNIFLYRQNAKLRSHTIKHFFDKNEIKFTWKKLMTIEVSTIEKCIDELKDLGCHYYTNNSSEHLCKDCYLTDPCTEIIREFELEYLRIISEMIQGGGEIPRHARFHSKAYNTKMICIMPDRPIVAKASKYSEDDYNLVTFYSGGGKSFTEMRHQVTGSIRAEADKNLIDWTTINTWGMNQEDPYLKGRAKSKKNKKKLKPYTRGGGKNFRVYLDDIDDDEYM